jgi:two-component system sensor histidine kinase SenX3
MSPNRRDQTSAAGAKNLRKLADRAVNAQLDRDRLALERDRLARAFDACRDGVVVVDATGTEVYRNAAAERYREARHGDAVVAAVLGTVLAAARAGTESEREIQVFGPPPAALRLHGIPLVDGEVTLGASVFVYDVSEIHRVESVRRDFVANVSHELKTPIGALELLAETLASEEDVAITRPLAERMVKETERLGRIVDDLLDLSLIETQEAPTRGPVPAGVLVAEAMERVRSAAVSAGIELRVEERAAGAIVACDRRQVVSAIVNLVDNAIKYSEAGRPVDVETAVEGSDLVIVVRDRGIGIPRRDLERIFERFYRVDHARSRATGGTGLGLAIVRHVVQAHGGEVTVESVEGEGSTLRLRLPLDHVDVVDEETVNRNGQREERAR